MMAGIDAVGSKLKNFLGASTPAPFDMQKVTYKLNLFPKNRRSS